MYILYLMLVIINIVFYWLECKVLNVEFFNDFKFMIKDINFKGIELFKVE